MLPALLNHGLSFNHVAPEHLLQRSRVRIGIGLLEEQHLGHVSSGDVEVVWELFCTEISFLQLEIVACDFDLDSRQSVSLLIARLVLQRIIVCHIVELYSHGDLAVADLICHVDACSRVQSLADEWHVVERIDISPLLYVDRSLPVCDLCLVSRIRRYVDVKASYFRRRPFLPLRCFCLDHPRLQSLLPYLQTNNRGSGEEVLQHDADDGDADPEAFRLYSASHISMSSSMIGVVMLFIVVVG